MPARWSSHRRGTVLRMRSPSVPDGPGAFTSAEKSESVQTGFGRFLANEPETRRETGGTREIQPRTTGHMQLRRSESFVLTVLSERAMQMQSLSDSRRLSRGGGSSIGELESNRSTSALPPPAPASRQRRSHSPNCPQ